MKKTFFKFISIALIGLCYSTFNYGVVVASKAKSGHVDVTVINETKYPITIQGEHKKGTHATGDITKGFSLKDKVRDTEIQKVTGLTIILPGGRGVYTFNKQNEYKYIPKQKAPNGKIISLEARHGNSFKSHPVWQIVEPGQIVPPIAPVIIEPVPVVVKAVPVVVV